MDPREHEIEYVAIDADETIIGGQLNNFIAKFISEELFPGQRVTDQLQVWEPYQVDAIWEELLYQHATGKLKINILPTGNTGDWYQIFQALLQDEKLKVSIVSFTSFKEILERYLKTFVGLSDEDIKKLRVEAWLVGNPTEENKNVHLYRVVTNVPVTQEVKKPSTDDEKQTFAAEIKTLFKKLFLFDDSYKNLRGILNGLGSTEDVSESNNVLHATRGSSDNPGTLMNRLKKLFNLNITPASEDKKNEINANLQKTLDDVVKNHDKFKEELRVRMEQEKKAKHKTEGDVQQKEVQQKEVPLSYTVIQKLKDFVGKLDTNYDALETGFLKSNKNIIKETKELVLGFLTSPELRGNPDKKIEAAIRTLEAKYKADFEAWLPNAKKEWEKALSTKSSKFNNIFHQKKTYPPTKDGYIEFLNDTRGITKDQKGHHHATRLIGLALQTIYDTNPSLKISEKSYVGNDRIQRPAKLEAMEKGLEVKQEQKSMQLR